MSTVSLHPAILPVLRPDIEFHLGPDDSDGAPTYVIQDPLQGTYDRATWVQAQILKLLRVPLTFDQLVQQLAANTTIRVAAEDVRRLCADASSKGLTVDSCVADVGPWEARRGRPKRALVETLLRKSIYVRIPLFKPDAFLERTVHLARHLAGPTALSLYLAVSLMGVILLAQRFDAYLSTFPHFFNAHGAVCFMLALITLKAIHELSHAYVAKAMGNRVPTMGVALILLFPVAYTDVTDSWRMHSRRKRLIIGLAGVFAELVIAGLALFVWAISPPGLGRSICFVVSSATLLSTMLVNLNPAMRFDGYYVLSDLLAIDNLQSRSFASTRWALRRYMLGMKVEAPEAVLPTWRLAIMVAYSIFAWFYRLFLFCGIALILYHRLTKVIGGVLFVMTICLLIVKPVLGEVVKVMKMRRLSGWNLRMIVVTIACALALLWVTAPLPRWYALPATTTPGDSQVIYAPNSGVIRELSIGLGNRVRKGQTLFVIGSEELESQSRLADLEVQRIRIELAVVKNNEKQRALLPQKTEELARAIAKRESIRTAIDSNRIVAELDGTVVEWDVSVRNGTPVGAEQVLGRILDHRRPEVVCYVRHDLAPDIATKDRVYFSSKARPGRLWGTVTNVDPVRATYLAHRSLSSVSGGDIAVTPDSQNRLKIVDSYYEVEVVPDALAYPLRLGQTGWVWMRTTPRSRLADGVRYIYRVLIRESSF
ncbi:MAG: HlyD family efflux transporter periplasmic adaptor subunit [Phycisphaerae bacterium]